MTPIRRHPLVAFFVLAFALSWWAVPFGGFLPCGPLVAGLIVIGATRGRAGLRELWASMIRRPGARRWYAIAVVLPLAVAAVALSINLALGAPVHALSHLDPWYLLLGVALLRLVDPLDGPLGEEPGWRGFALPQLLERHSPLRATSILAALVALWHLPLVFLPEEHLPPLFLLATVAVTFVYTWLYLGSGRSVLITMLAHAFEGVIRFSVLGFTGAAATRMTVAYTAVWVVLAVALWWRRGAMLRVETSACRSRATASTRPVAPATGSPAPSS